MTAHDPLDDPDLDELHDVDEPDVDEDQEDVDEEEEAAPDLVFASVDEWFRRYWRFSYRRRVSRQGHGHGAMERPVVGERRGDTAPHGPVARLGSCAAGPGARHECLVGEPRGSAHGRAALRRRAVRHGAGRERARGAAAVQAAAGGAVRARPATGGDLRRLGVSGPGIGEGDRRGGPPSSCARSRTPRATHHRIDELPIECSRTSGSSVGPLPIVSNLNANPQK